MSHGKSVMLSGSTKKPIEFPNSKKKTYFKATAEVGIAYTHGKIAGDASKAETEIVNDINVQIDSAWKKDKAAGDSPEITKADLEFSTFSKKS